MDWETQARWSEAQLADAEARLEAVRVAHSKLHGRCDNPICPLRAALSVAPQPQPRDKESSIDFRKQWDADVASGGRHIDMSFMQDEQAAWVKCSNNGHSWHRADLPCDAKVHTPVTSS
jgi:hypothetical protein